MTTASGDDLTLGDIEEQAENQRLRDALSTVLTRCEDANAAWSRLDVAAVAREALAGDAE